MPFLYHSVAVLDHYCSSDFCAENPHFDCPFGRGYFHSNFRGRLWVPSHSVWGGWRPLATLDLHTYRLVDVVCEYSHTFLCGPTHLMAILAFDPFGRELFEHWH